MYSIHYMSVVFALIIIFSFIITSKLTKGYVYQSKNLNLTIEGLRGLACIFVFVNHSAWVMTNNNISSESINYSIFNYFGNFGSFGVELFFCITGFLFSSKIKNGKFDLIFFEKRIKRLAPAYILVSTLVLILFTIKYNYLINSFSDFSLLIQQIYGFGFFGSGISIGNEVITSLNVVTWTLPYEWKFYATIPFIAVIFRNKKLLIPLILFALLYSFSQYLENHTLWVYFVIGFLGSYLKQVTEKPLRSLLVLLSVLLLIFSIISDEYQYGFLRIFYVGAFFLVCLLSNPFYLKMNTLTALGTISYGIYILHQPIMFSISNILVFLSSRDDFSFKYLLIISLSSLVITTILSIFMYKYVERRFI